jgi:dTDP-4-dehydrorhamnose 3,5-epimerase
MLPLMPPAVQVTQLHEALLFTPEIFADERGFFKETFSVEKYRALGLRDTFVQDSISHSVRNVVRGMHGDRRMSKLVQVVHGSVFDVIADLREGSPTYRRWEGFHLSEENHRQLYVPAGFVHGFLVLSDTAGLAYKHSTLYDRAHEFNIRWNDPSLAIDWPVTSEPILSERDRNAPLLIATPQCERISAPVSFA